MRIGDRRMLNQEKLQERAYDTVSMMREQAKKLIDGMEEMLFTAQLYFETQGAFSESEAHPFKDNKGWIERLDRQTQAVCIRQSREREGGLWSFIFFIRKTKENTLIYCYRMFEDFDEVLLHLPPEYYLDMSDTVYSFYTDNTGGVNKQIRRPDLSFFKSHYKELSDWKSVGLEHKLFGFLPLFSAELTYRPKEKQPDKARDREQEMQKKWNAEYTIFAPLKQMQVILFSCFYLSDILEDINTYLAGQK